MVNLISDLKQDTPDGLLKYLEQLDRRVLYFDTDSVFSTQKGDEWVPTIPDF